MIPCLRVLSDGREHKAREIITAAADLLNVTEEQRQITIPSGQLQWLGRGNWALSDLNRVRAVTRPSRGHYVITELGHQLLQRFPEGMRKADLPQPVDDAPQSPSASEPQLDPTEQLESVIAGIEQQVAHDLLDRLRNSHPDFFEEAVVKVLLAMGYGGSEQRGKRIGGTGDGGVDGVIDQDALGLDQIYVQAKRYAEGNNVGRETIQAFIGALHGFGASRGVFITSSDFTSGAVEYARQVPTRVVLINGQRLASLMIKHRVGVQVTHTYSVVDIDEDFFE